MNVRRFMNIKKVLILNLVFLLINTLDSPTTYAVTYHISEFGNDNFYSSGIYFRENFYVSYVCEKNGYYWIEIQKLDKNFRNIGTFKFDYNKNRKWFTSLSFSDLEKTDFFLVYSVHLGGRWQIKIMKLDENLNLEKELYIEDKDNHLWSPQVLFNENYIFISYLSGLVGQPLDLHSKKYDLNLNEIEDYKIYRIDFFVSPFASLTCDGNFFYTALIENKEPIILKYDNNFKILEKYPLPENIHEPSLKYLNGNFYLVFISSQGTIGIKVYDKDFVNESNFYISSYGRNIEYPSIISPPYIVYQGGKIGEREIFIDSVKGIEADVAKGYYMDGDNFLNAQKYQKAKDSFELAKLLFEDIGYSDDVQKCTEKITICEKYIDAENMFNGGVELLNKRSFKDAKEKFEECKGIYESLGDDEKIFLCDENIQICANYFIVSDCYEKGNSYQLSRDYKNALKEFNKALELYTELEDTDNITKIQEKINYCNQKIKEEKTLKQIWILAIGIVIVVCIVLVLKFRKPSLSEETKIQIEEKKKYIENYRKIMEQDPTKKELAERLIKQYEEEIRELERQVRK